MKVKKLWPIIPVLLLFGISCCPCMIRSVLAPGADSDDCSDVQVVTTIPAETVLDRAGTVDTTAEWVDMINRAERTIDFSEFYLSAGENGPLQPIVAAVKAAARRGVRIRILTDTTMADIYPHLNRRFRETANITVVLFDWRTLNSGKNHAKFFIVDDREAFLGSQNFDWRAMKHIHETGLRIECKPVVRALKRIFELDWAFNNGYKDAYARLNQEPPFIFGSQIYLVASPPELNPPGVENALDTLIRLIDGAAQKITIQLLSYQVYQDDGESKFSLIDDALRRAAARGVQVKLLVSDWNKRKPGVRGVRELAAVPGIEIKFATIPEFSGGFIPYARVIHSKVMRIDDDISWVGTSNWGYGYFFQLRNVELVCRFPEMARTLDRLFDDLWSSPYTEIVDPARDYRPPRIN